MDKQDFIEETLTLVNEELRDSFPVTAYEQKGAGEFVTEEDKRMETFIRDRISVSYPDDDILGEEYGGSDIKDGGAWVIDPIDGTTNFSHNVPFFCAAIAHVEAGVVTHSGVASPLHDTVWTAQRGGGAYADGEPIDRGDTPGLGEAVIGFCHGPSSESAAWIGSRYEAMKEELGDARQFGAADLELTLSGTGHLAGFIGYQISPWDFLPGCLVASEAGCKVTGLDGEDWMEPGVDSVVAAPPGLHDDLRSIVD